MFYNLKAKSISLYILLAFRSSDLVIGLYYSFSEERTIETEQQRQNFIFNVFVCFNTIIYQL